jgi:hypothetical protein
MRRARSAARGARRQHALAEFKAVLREQGFMLLLDQGRLGRRAGGAILVLIAFFGPTALLT